MYKLVAINEANNGNETHSRIQGCRQIQKDTPSEDDNNVNIWAPERLSISRVLLSCCLSPLFTCALYFRFTFSLISDDMEECSDAGIGILNLQ